MAFGDEDIYVEKCILNPKHIEVQILGDEQGHVVHLHERDCSIQRRHQKVIEMAPAWSLPRELREAICQAALKLMENVHYVNAGTVEFLADQDEKHFYFIEVNPRVQVEHTVTEAITDMDIVKAQILIAEGHSLDDPEIHAGRQGDIPCNGVAIQCRITTEDPQNQFMPDTGKIIAYRSGGGPGIRLDAGTAYQGAVITPYYDSLLVKVTAHAMDPLATIHRMLRCLDEFRISGVKTNIFFLKNMLQDPAFQAGACDVNYIDRHPELLVDPEEVSDRGTRMLTYIGEVTVNGYRGNGHHTKPEFPPPVRLETDGSPCPAGTKQLLDQLGPDAFARWILDQKQVLLMDTTYRDAHQSLLATRIRTRDILGAIHYTAQKVPQLYAFENWGGATFDACLRFLKEDPWDRLRKLRDGFKNTKLQMLFRGQNILGYRPYADDVVDYFVQKSISNGIDIIRIFDCLNDLRNLQEAVNATNKFKAQEGRGEAQVALAYTLGDAYTLEYWTSMAKKIEEMGADAICIKDMAGLLVPYKAAELIKAMKEVTKLPIQLHTHYTSGVASMTYLKAVEAGVDVIDTAMSPFAMGTSQPATEVMVETFKGTPYDTGLDQNLLAEIADYFRPYRDECLANGLLNPKVMGVDIKTLLYQVPGGMLSNMVSQLKEQNAEDRYYDVLKEIPKVRKDLGEPPLVTPSSQIVGTQAVFNVLLGERYKMATKETKAVLRGEYGQTVKPMSQEVIDKVIPGEERITCRYADLLDNEMDKLEGEMKEWKQQDEDVLSYALFPQVATDFFKYRQAQQEKVDMTQADTKNGAYPV